MPNFLTRRGATYYFRRVIPEELRAQFGSRREIILSLRTKDRAEAIRGRNKEAVRTDNLFAAAAEALGRPLGKLTETRSPMSQLSAAERITRLVHNMKIERDAANAQGQLAAFNQQLRDELVLCELDLEHGTWNEDDPVDLDRARIMKSAVQAVLDGDFSRLATPAAAEGPQRLWLSLDDLVSKWAEERPRRDRSVDMWKRTAALFTQVTGKSMIREITKADVLAFKASLQKKNLAPATIDSRLNHLRAVFRFGVTNDLISADPTATVQSPVGKRAKDALLQYDPAALAAVFGSDVYLQGMRPVAGGGEAAYWLPLLALYTGARMNELGQLRPKDIVQERYYDADDVEQAAWVIRLVEDQREGLTLKNANSSRRVPVHGALINQGFLRLVEAARSKNQARIFPDLKPDRYGNATGNWSKWYGKYLRTVCGVSDTRVTFHSFRHSFKHHARMCGLDKAVNDALTGHSGGSTGEDYGGLEYPLRPLVEGMARYRVQGFALPPPPGDLKTIYPDLG